MNVRIRIGVPLIGGLIGQVVRRPRGWNVPLGDRIPVKFDPQDLDARGAPRNDLRFRLAPEDVEEIS